MFECGHVHVCCARARLLTHMRFASGRTEINRTCRWSITIHPSVICRSLISCDAIATAKQLVKIRCTVKTVHYICLSLPLWADALHHFVVMYWHCSLCFSSEQFFSFISNRIIMDVIFTFLLPFLLTMCTFYVLFYIRLLCMSYER